MYANDGNLKSDPESPLELQSESTMTCVNDKTSIETWTESRVSIGILLNRNIGLKVAKYFETGYFIGQVTNVYASHSKNEVFYHIKYEDGDSEDFGEEELQEGLALYQGMQKQKKRKYNQRKGAKIAKYFETGIFIGLVKHVRTSDYKRDGSVLYNIEYEDGDSEDFDEKELKEGIALYRRFQNRQNQAMARSKQKETRLNEDFHHLTRSNEVSHSFGALYDDTTPIHTLILGTHPAKKSLSENRYFAHHCNAFWWIAGDCLGFRRDRGETCNGGLMKLCAHLRYDESYIIPYRKQVDTLCQHGFALWDIIASCQRKGSLDCAIKNDKPNDIEKFVEQHPTIQTIVMANGKSGLNFFNRHFSKWLKSGKLVLHEGEVTSKSEATSNWSGVKAEDAHIITCICALSVSPAATLPYSEKRDFWESLVYAPGLKLNRQLATAKKIKITPSFVRTADGVMIPSKA